MKTLLRTATAGAALVLLLAACAEEPDGAEPADEPAAIDETEEPAEEPEETAEEPEETAEEPEPTDGGEGTVATASTDLGEVLVDGEGMTLYVFDNDEGGESTCYDDCAGNWPPLIVDGEADAGEGADASLLGTTERDDGTTQITYDGWPLYHWAGDNAPGETNGHGVGEVWWVIAPDGTPLRENETAQDGSRGGGYDY